MMKSCGVFLFILITALIDSSLQQAGNCDCKKRELCKPWVDAINQGKYLNLPVCGFDNHPHTPLLCCPRGRRGKRSISEEPSENGTRETEQTPQNKYLSSAHKAEQKCAEYGKAVFKQIPSPPGKIDTCGIESRIQIPIASPQEYPHQALIGYGDGEEKKTWVCAGTLISERFVITSAICSQPPKSIKSQTLWVKLGEGDRESIPQLYRVIERVKHPESDRRSWYNDIALLKLEKDVEFSPTIRPACVYTTSQVPGIIKFPFFQNNQYGEDIPMKIVKHDMKLIRSKECNELNNHFTQQGVLNESFVCARHFFRNQFECKETLGSSMVFPLKEPYCMHAVVGMAIVGKEACSKETIVGTRIPHYLPWIVDHVWPE